jgi:hypothetical protein
MTTHPIPDGGMPPPSLDFRALCAELAERLDRRSMKSHKEAELIATARAALAAEPQGPTDEEIVAFADEQCFLVGIITEPLYVVDVAGFAHALLARWGSATPRPIPVTERLPGAEDRDDDGDCWWLTPSDEETGAFWCLYEGDIGEHTHWLPAPALPLPGVKG